MSKSIYKPDLPSNPRQYAVFGTDGLIVFITMILMSYFFVDYKMLITIDQFYDFVGVFIFFYYLIPSLLLKGRSIGMLIFKIEIRRHGKPVGPILNIIRSLLAIPIHGIGMNVWLISTLFGKQWSFDPIFQCYMYHKKRRPAHRKKR